MVGTYLAHDIPNLVSNLEMRKEMVAKEKYLGPQG